MYIYVCRHVCVYSDVMRHYVYETAAMWTRPHLICLDEPTNFLDKETFNGLVRALKNFKGAVLTISHNQEFVDQVPERFHTPAHTYTHTHIHTCTHTHIHTFESVTRITSSSSSSNHMQTYTTLRRALCVQVASEKWLLDAGVMTVQTRKDASNEDDDTEESKAAAADA